MSLLNWVKTPFVSNPSNLDSCQGVDLSEFLDSLESVVMILDHHLHISKVNQSWETVTGMSVINSLNKPFIDYLHPEDQSTWDSALQRLSDSFKSEQIWLRLIGADGDIRWCEMRVQCIKPDTLYPLSATLSDITPQVRREQTRNASHRSLDSLVSRLPAMLYRSRNNISWTMEYVSQGCEELTGYSAESLINQTLVSYGSLIHEEDANNVWECVQVALQQQRVFELTYRIIHQNGDIITVKDKGLGVYSDSGEILGVEGIILTLNHEMSSPSAIELGKH
ncbi:MAG: PAS domain-containing protein [Arenicella sp.]